MWIKHWEAWHSYRN